MNKIRAFVAAAVALLAATAGYAQQFNSVPAQSVIGRLGVPGDTGPSQSISFSKLAAQLGVNNAAPVFNVANYATPQLAVNAAIANKGGVVYFPCGTYNLGAGATGITLDDSAFPIRLTGPGNAFGGAANKCIQITYGGTGTMISARSTNNLELDHLYLVGASAAKGIDISGSAISPGVGATFPSIHDNLIQTNAGPAAIGIDADNTQGPIIRHNFIASTGIGISGVRTAGGFHFAVSAMVSENIFGAGGRISILAPGENWTVSGNVSELPTAAFVSPGPVGTCKGLIVSGNWIGDFSPGVGATDAIVHSNCGTLTSIGNRYANAAGSTDIKQDPNTGSIASIGDALEGTTGIDITSNNVLTLQVPDPNLLPATLVVGTAGTDPAMLMYGVISFSGALAINSNAVVLPVSSPTPMLKLGNADGVNTGAEIFAFGTSAAPLITTFRSRGTNAVSTAAQLNDSLGTWLALGYGASGFGTASAAIQASAAENFTNTAKGAYWGFTTATIGTATVVERMRIQAGLMAPATVTGGDMGAGTLNLGSNLYVNGVAYAAFTKTLTNTTLDSAGTGNVLKVGGVTVSPGQYPGEPSTSSATAGNVGEYVQGDRLPGSPLSLTTGTAASLTSISLTAGDWDVTGFVGLTPAATTNVTVSFGGISLVNNTIDTAPLRSVQQISPTTGGTVYNNAFSFTLPTARLSLSATTTVYLVATANFTVSTMTAYGSIRARRVR
jgi:hypothetical protein